MNGIQQNPSIGNSKNCYICGEKFGNGYSIFNSSGVSCCKCMKNSYFNKKFSYQNCNSEFCFECGQGNYLKKYEYKIKFNI